MSGIEGDPQAALFAHVLALRVVIQDMLGRQAASTNDFGGTLRHLHACAIDDLTRVKLDGQNPEIDAEILEYAGAVVDSIFAHLRSGPPPR